MEEVSEGVREGERAEGEEVCGLRSKPFFIHITSTQESHVLETLLKGAGEGDEDKDRRGV